MLFLQIFYGHKIATLLSENEVGNLFGFTYTRKIAFYDYPR